MQGRRVRARNRKKLKKKIVKAESQSQTDREDGGELDRHRETKRHNDWRGAYRDTQRKTPRNRGNPQLQEGLCQVVKLSLNRHDYTAARSTDLLHCHRQ